MIFLRSVSNVCWFSYCLSLFFIKWNVVTYNGHYYHRETHKIKFFKDISFLKHVSRVTRLNKPKASFAIFYVLTVFFSAPFSLTFTLSISIQWDTWTTISYEKVVLSVAPFWQSRREWANPHSKITVKRLENNAQTAWVLAWCPIWRRDTFSHRPATSSVSRLVAGLERRQNCTREAALSPCTVGCFFLRWKRYKNH